MAQLMLASLFSAMQSRPPLCSQTKVFHRTVSLPQTILTCMTLSAMQDHQAFVQAAVSRNPSSYHDGHASKGSSTFVPQASHHQSLSQGMSQRSVHEDLKRQAAILTGKQSSMCCI